MKTDHLIAALCEIYDHWIAWSKLPPYRADELIFSESITEEQRQFLTAFITLWDTVDDLAISQSYTALSTASHS